MKEFVKIFKALSDAMRLRIICVLIKADTELCVCEIMDSLQENQYNISRHLKVLLNANMVEERKEGRWTLYSLVNTDAQFQPLLRQAIRAIPEKFLARDYARLCQRLSFRTQGKCVIGMNTEAWRKILQEMDRQEKVEI
jgi:ArsR family transcriptional regulator